MKLYSGILCGVTAAVLSCQPHDGKTGLDGQKGAHGEKGENAEAPARAGTAINHVTPRVGLVDRTIDVTVAIDSIDTHFDLSKAKLDIDFGDGVSVRKASIVGERSIVATLEISAKAKLGKHDVIITIAANRDEANEPETLRAKSAFVVAVPLDAKVVGGKAEQGGLVRLAIHNRDKIWFDTNKFELFPLLSTNTSADPNAKKDASLVALAYNVTATDGTVVFLGDPLAKTGKLGFLGFNDPSDEGSASFLSEPDAVTVSSRAPIALTPETPIDKTFDQDLDTGFFVADVPAPGLAEGFIVDAWARVPVGSTMSPMIVAYASAGSSADVVDQKRNDPGFPDFGIPATEARVAYPVTAKSSKTFFVVMDAGLKHSATTKLSMSYSETRAEIVAEKAAAHRNGATAQTLGSLPVLTNGVAGRIVTGELSAADEVDVYKFSGLSANLPTDMLVSVTSESDVVVRVDTVATFDSPNLVEITRGGTAGAGTTTDAIGTERFVRVSAVPDSGKPTGKYTIGMKRIASGVTRR